MKNGVIKPISRCLITIEDAYQAVLPSDLIFWYHAAYHITMYYTQYSAIRKIITQSIFLWNSYVKISLLFDPPRWGCNTWWLDWYFVSPIGWLCWVLVIVYPLVETLPTFVGLHVHLIWTSARATSIQWSLIMTTTLFIPQTAESWLLVTHS